MHERDELDIAFHAGVTIELSANANRDTGGEQTTGLGMQNAIGVAETHRAFAIEAVRVDARSLRRDICANTHHPPA